MQGHHPSSELGIFAVGLHYIDASFYMFSLLHCEPVRMNTGGANGFGWPEVLSF